MKPGDAVVVRCDDLDSDGAGCGEVDGVRVHIAGALPDEEVEAHVTHVSPHHPRAWAALDRIVRSSPARVPAPCGAFTACGGCPLQALSHPAQLAWKTRAMRQRVATRPALAGTRVDDMVPSPRLFGYRNNAKLVVARAPEGQLLLGAYAPRSHDVVDLGGCQVVEPAVARATEAMRRVLTEQAIVPYDERHLTGDVRYVVLRADGRGQVLATIVTARRAWPSGPAVASALLASDPEIAGVVQNVNPTRGNVIFGPEDLPLAGAQALEDAIGPARLHLSPRAFFQANRDVAALAYDAIARAVAPAPSDLIVDVYAGVGGIALTLAPHAREVLGIEENPVAVADAIVSARAAGARARFVQGDAAARLKELERADAVVVNPPRKGCGPAVLDEIARLAPRVIAYLSCGPDTLMRDLEHLATHGYRTESITPFDMLPHTPHIEALAIVRR